MKIFGIAKDVLSRLLAPAEDPRPLYQETLNRHARLIEEVHRAKAGLSGARSRLEAHISAVRRNRLTRSALHPQNPFEEELTGLIAEEVADLEAELILLDREEQALNRLEEHLNLEEQVVQARQQAAEAHQVVSEARSAAKDQIGAAMIDFARFDRTVDHAEQRAQSAEAKVAAASRIADLASSASDQTDPSRMLAARYAVVASEDSTEEIRPLLAVGFRTLIDLESEFRQLGSLFDSFKDSNLLVSDRVQLLVSETYRQGVSVLSAALTLAQSLSFPGRPGARPARVGPVMEGGDTRDDSLDRAERPDGQPAGELRELIEQAKRCAAALSQTRIEMTAARAQGIRRDAETTVSRLQGAIEEAKAIQSELQGLNP